MSAREYARILDLATAALHERYPDRLWPLIAAEVPRICGGDDLFIRKSEEWSAEAGTVRLWTPGSPGAGCVDDDAGRALRHGYPWADYARSTTDRAPVTAGQAAGERTWRMSPTAAMMRTAFGTDHILGLPLPRASGPFNGYLLYRSGSAFTEAHLARARRLQPVLDSIERQHELLVQWRQATRSADAHTDPDEPADDYGLTPREISVLSLLAKSLTATAIGRRLGISPRTVHKHIENLYRKMGTTDRMATVLRAKACHLLPRSPEARP
ncbi:LuxR C-terminal-related transcriptional regulator [Streptomyces noursei]|uniref:Helix-turn-helix transcriptional regulator n=1 Tax=Streptomyces noursei TaxID=1971 RepID=A0A401QVF5_STRNR|nr:LuxR C-terminal-related transcriptional regulator [Streptomyces noursei]MCZ0974801.1 LuxR C-terminal-related transcriptional regulator [Streptomyces noursei]UWS70548.1 LuxR C-terminal-related transcriptional regulator [Streptomyces noursei]GCB89272.1 helix-turn-helix transcriptional regulator [Streptomyces noursei]